MKTRPHVSCLLAVLAFIAFLHGCGPSVPSTPPTFVLAYTGTDRRVHTLQSVDGSDWVLPAIAAGPDSTAGVTVVHDRNLVWMVLWNSNGSLSYITGIGGLPSANATSGIVWESAATTLRTTSPVLGTPALAFVNQKWIAVFASPAGARVVTSLLDSNPLFPADVATVGVSAIGAVPALAFGRGTLVLASLVGGDLVAQTSADGINWSTPSTIFAHFDPGPPENHDRICISPSSATLSFADGLFYAVGRQSGTRCEGETEAGGSSIVVYRSVEGRVWSNPVDRQEGPPVVREEAGIPGAAFAQCKLVLAYTQTLAGFPPVNVPNSLVTRVGQASPCSIPQSFAFGPEQTTRSAAPARLDGVMAVAFGSRGGS